MSKIHEKAQNIFKFIKLLLEAPATPKELCRNMACEEEENEGLSENGYRKYIYTLKKAGFEITSTALGIVQVASSPFSCKLDEKGLDGLLVFEDVGEGIFQSDGALKEKFNILDKKLRTAFSNCPQKQKSKTKDLVYYRVSEKTNKKIDIISRHMSKMPNPILEARIRGKLRHIIPEGIFFAANGAFLEYYDCFFCTRKIINIIYVEKIDFLMEGRYEDKVRGYGTTFRLKGRLKENYMLKIGERAKYTKDFVYVTNYHEPKNVLFNRLLKYGDRCEIVSPKRDRERFLNRLQVLQKYYREMLSHKSM